MMFQHRHSFCLVTLFVTLTVIANGSRNDPLTDGRVDISTSPFSTRLQRRLPSTSIRAGGSRSVAPFPSVVEVDVITPTGGSLFQALRAFTKTLRGGNWLAR